MFATTGSAALSESRVSYLTRLSVENDDVVFSKEEVVADIFESFVPARADLRPDRVPDMIAVLSPHSQVHLGADARGERVHKQLGKTQFHEKKAQSRHPVRDNGKQGTSIPNGRKTASLRECIVRELIIKTLSRCEDGCRLRHLVLLQRRSQ